MSQTDNGYPARPDLPLRPLVVNGVAFSPGIADDDDVETVLRYVVEQYADRVEPLRSPGCWGFAYRENRNSPNSLSRHSGGIAVDVNAPAHPNGVPTYKTFTIEQIREVHRILGEVEFAVRWGGDYTGTPDAMHFEINTTPAMLRVVADRLRGDDDMTPDQDTRLKAIEDKVDVLGAAVAKLVAGFDKFRGNEWRRDVEGGQQLDRIEGQTKP